MIRLVGIVLGAYGPFLAATRVYYPQSRVAVERLWIPILLSAP